MPITIPNKAQTAGTNIAVLKITKPTPGNLLVVFVHQSSTASAPKGKDSINGETGWNAPNATFAESASQARVYLVTKTATGEEVELTPVPGAGGVIRGMTYFELAGSSGVIEKIEATNKGIKAKTLTSGALTTTHAEDAILACCGVLNSSGTVEAWTGTNALANTTTTTTQCIGGSLVPAKTLTTETFTAHWLTERESCMLVAAFEATETGNTKTLAGSVEVKFGQTDAVAAQAALTSSAAVKFAPITAALHSETGSTKTLAGAVHVKVGGAGAVGAKAALRAVALVPFGTEGELADRAVLAGPSAVKIATAAKLVPQGALQPTAAVRFVAIAALSSNAAFTTSGATAVRLAAHATLTPGTIPGEPSGRPGRVNPRMLAGVADAS